MRKLATALITALILLSASATDATVISVPADQPTIQAEFDAAT